MRRRRPLSSIRWPQLRHLFVFVLLQRVSCENEDDEEMKGCEGMPFIVTPQKGKGFPHDFDGKMLLSCQTARC